MNRVDLEKLPEFLLAQRWFGGKAWPIKSVAVIDHATLPDKPGCPVLAVIEVRYELGSPERYLLAVHPEADGGVKDALQEDELTRAVLELIRRGGELSSGAAKLRGERIGNGGTLDTLPQAPQVRRLNVEQSNTSIVFEEKVILKVIRKLQLGINPEYEMGRFLAKTGFRATPALLGALHLEGQAGSTVAVLHHFAPNKGDGWSWLLEALRAGEPADAIVKELHALGQRIGELHAALASDPSDPAFAPEPVQLEDLQRWSSSIIGELGVTLAEASKQFPDVFSRRNAVVERLSRLAHLKPSGMKIRIHGDLHLGQVLRAETGWLIFDFEGEPERPMAQRREKQSPLKDVAGMVRSLGYAGATLAREGTVMAGHLLRARQALIDGYRQAVAGMGLVPETAADFAAMLDAFELEKLLYEVRYELRNRPDWVQIPMSALMQPAAP